MSEKSCIRCGDTGKINGMGLCKNKCYGWMRSGKGTPDVDYFVWLLGARDPSRIVMPNELLAPMIERALERVGSLGELADWVGVSSRRLYAVRTGKNGSYKMGCGLARLLDCMEWFEAQACQIGRSGWSDVGSYCGDGSGVLNGCGTYFHEHYADGLCEECWLREVLGHGPAEPRDVRVAGMRGRAKV